jgi:hypothetical protein
MEHAAEFKNCIPGIAGLKQDIEQGGRPALGGSAEFAYDLAFEFGTIWEAKAPAGSSPEYECGLHWENLKSGEIKRKG